MAEANKKTCFVTIGATASFTSLIKGVLEPEFIQALSSQGYTDLLVQYGEDGQEYFESCRSKASEEGNIVNIRGFPLDKAGLVKYMALARGDEGGQEGVVISHAGTGTVLDAMRISVPLIVVPNEDLLDNHQVELAEQLASMEYVVHGRLGRLPQALEDAEKLRVRHRSWPPVNAGEMRQPKGLKGVIDDEMGYLD